MYFRAICSIRTGQAKQERYMALSFALPILAYLKWKWSQMGPHLETSMVTTRVCKHVHVF